MLFDHAPSVIVAVYVPTVPSTGMLANHPPRAGSRTGVIEVIPAPLIVNVAEFELTAVILNVVPRRNTAASVNKY